MTAYTAVGHRIPRADAYEKVTGAARYAGDLKFPGMLHGKLLRSPHAHARIRSIDTARAAGLPGVLAILHHGNTERKLFAQSEYTATAPDAAPPPDQYLFDAVVRYAGEPVAAIAAVDADTAERAAELVAVEYEPLPVVTDPLEALRPEAPVINRNAASQGNLAMRIPIHFGDVETGFAEAEVTIERRFRTSKQKHVQTEPYACVAEYDARGRLTVWTPNQTPHPLRKQLAQLFDLPISRVRVVTPPVGGGFGGRVGFVGEHWAAALAMATRRPVRLEYSRLEDFIGTESRHPMIIEARIGAKRDGTLTAMHLKTWSNAGPYITQSPDVTAVHGQFFLRLYRCANRWYDGHVVYTNTPVSGAYRGFGAPQAYFALEQMIDELAERLGRDPLDLRRQLAVQKGEIDQWTQLPIRSGRFQDCLDAGARAIGWAEKRGRRRRDGPWAYGVGCGCIMWVSGTACLHPGMVEGSGATVRLNLDGTIDVVSGATDLGTGIATALAQVAAETLGVPVDHVRVVLGDTDVTPFDAGSHASRTMFNAGNAVARAAADARQQILDVAASLLEASPADLEVCNGRVEVKGVPDVGIGLAELAMKAYARVTEIIGKGYAPQANAPPYAAHFAEVAVNTETGEVKPIRYVAVHDVGRAINPTTVEGQIEGAVFHGIGYALSEDLIVDPVTGSALNASFMDYKVLTAADMPELTTILLEDPDPDGPFGAKGIGEVGLPPVAGAIANAIYDATGARVTQLPMTPERVLQAIRAAGDGAGTAAQGQ